MSAIDKRFKALDINLRNSFQKIKDELEDHLQTLNENTKEIENNYEFLCELDNKIAKLTERIDDIHLMMTKIMNQASDQISLTEDEQKVFLILYTFGEETLLSFSDIARKLNMPELLVRKAISSMMIKGIPIIEKQIDKDSFFEIDSKFKEEQATKNIIKIDEKITKLVQIF